MIVEGSRYEMGTVQRIEAADGVVRPTVYAGALPDGVVPSFVFEVITHDERIDNIAARVLGDSALWWAIADINPEIFDWVEIPSGTVLRLPRR